MSGIIPGWGTIFAYFTNAFSTTDEKVDDLEINDLTGRVEALAIGTLDSKLAYISGLKDKTKSLRAFVDLTQTELETGELLKLVTAFDKAHRSSIECNTFAHKAAKTLFQAGDLYGAREAAMKLVSGKTKQKVSPIEKERNALLVELASAALDQGNDALSYDCIAPIQSRNKQKNILLMKLGSKYLASANYIEALNFFRQVDDRTFAIQREEHLAELATCCITACDWKCAEHAIKAIIHDENVKASLLALLVDSCRFTGNIDDAFTILGRFTIFETEALREEIERLYYPIFKSYLTAEDHANAKKCLQKLLHLIIENEFSINGVNRAFKKDVAQYQRLRAFSSHLCDTYFDDLTRIFAYGDSEYAICHIRNFVSKRATLEAFKEHFKVEETPPSPPRSRADFRSKTEIASKKSIAYKLFNLSEDASVLDIKKRFNLLRLQHHPDKIIQLESETDKDYQIRLERAIEKFHEVSDAYNILMNT